MTLTSDLVLALSIGAPLSLLAIGVLVHAYLLARRPVIAGLQGVDEMLDALAAEPVEELLEELHTQIEELRTQLAGQRNTLEHLLSEGTRRPRSLPADQPAAGRSAGPPPPTPIAPPTRPTLVERPQAPISRAGISGSGAVRSTQPALETAPEPAPSAGGLRAAVAQLAAEGLSDRAIARRLHVGLEEVRSARLHAGLAR